MLKAVPDTTTKETLLFLHEFISHYGKPQRMVTDRGTAFTSIDFDAFCTEYTIQHRKVASATPRANGQVERLNRILLTCIATICNEDGDDWDNHISQVQWTINNVEHSVTKGTPYEVIFQKKGIGISTTPLTREIIELNEKLNVEDERESIADLLSKNRDKQKNYYDRHRKRARLYQSGDLVMIRSDVQSTGQSRKLEAKYKGPYEVVKHVGHDRYLVQDIEGERQSNKFYKAIVAVDRMKAITKEC